jgi:hypothetical protein
MFVNPLGKFFKKKVLKSIRVREVKGKHDTVLYEVEFKPPIKLTRGYEIVIDTEQKDV